MSFVIIISDAYFVSVIVIPYAKSSYVGPRYNDILLYLRKFAFVIFVFCLNFDPIQWCQIKDMYHNPMDLPQFINRFRTYCVNAQAKSEKSLVTYLDNKL